MNVLFLANKNVFSWPVSWNVNSDPRNSFGTGWSVGILEKIGATDVEVVVDISVSIVGSFVVVVCCGFGTFNCVVSTQNEMIEILIFNNYI